MLFIILFLASCVINEGDLNIRDARPKIVRWLGKHQWKRMKFQNILQMLFGQTLSISIQARHIAVSYHYFNLWIFAIIFVKFEKIWTVFISLWKRLWNTTHNFLRKNIIQTHRKTYMLQEGDLPILYAKSVR